MNRGLLVGVAVAGLALGGVALWLATSEPTVPIEPVAERARPNVLVIVWDTVRADRLSMYGYERSTTPRLDAWAKEHAVVFEQARSAGLWTLPAHASLFTGLDPESTGADERWMWLDHPHVTAAEHFSANGYATFSFAANTLLSTDTNLVQGFDVKMNTFKGKVRNAAQQSTRRKLLPRDVSQELSPHWKAPEHGSTNAEWARAIYKDAAPLIGKTFLKWISDGRPKDAPFFAYLNLMEAHTPRVPSLEARKLIVGDDRERFDRMLSTDAGHINLHFYNFGKHEYSDEELGAIGDVYDATLIDLDNATVDLLDAMDEQGWLNNTIVVITSDHGENLGDHHLFNHRFSLWDSLLHVPLVVAGPGLDAGRVETPVSTRELFATVASLTDVAPPAHVRGPSWFDEGTRPVHTHMALPLEREVQSVAAVHPDVSSEGWIREGDALVADGYKWLAFSDGTKGLYDLSADPGETNDLSEQQADRYAEMAAEVKAYREAMPPYNPDWRTPGDDPKHVRASQKELREQLKALGYAADDEELETEPDPPPGE